MLSTRETQTAAGRLHPGEGWVEFPLLLLDDQLSELEQKARSEKRTIGQMIRQSIGLYLAGARERGDCHDIGGDSQPDAASDAPGSLAVTLLFPVAQLAQLEALAARRATATSALIRRIVCCSLLGRSPDQQPSNESRGRCAGEGS